jgi:hypothetical protein
MCHIHYVFNNIVSILIIYIYIYIYIYYFIFHLQQTYLDLILVMNIVDNFKQMNFTIILVTMLLAKNHVVVIVLVMINYIVFPRNQCLQLWFRIHVIMIGDYFHSIFTSCLATWKWNTMPLQCHYLLFITQCNDISISQSILEQHNMTCKPTAKRK